MQIDSELGDSVAAKALAEDTLRTFPADTVAAQVRDQVAAVRLPSTPEDFLNRSLAAYRAGNFQQCIDEARAALKLKPDYAEAYNNIAAGYQSLGRWDDAIQAASEAVRLKPDFQLAKNNLAYAQEQKRLHAVRVR